MKHELLQALARCRVVEGSQMEKLLGFSLTEADSLVEEKLIAKETIKEGFRLIHYYTLTTRGESYVKQQLPAVKEIYRGFVQEQDLTLCDFYLRRSQAERDSWITKDDLIKQYKLPGTLDGAFLNQEGELVGVKAFSQKADMKAVEKVESFLQATNIKHVNYLVY